MAFHSTLTSQSDGWILVNHVPSLFPIIKINKKEYSFFSSKVPLMGPKTNMDYFRKWSLIYAFYKTIVFSSVKLVQHKRAPVKTYARSIIDSVTETRRKFLNQQKKNEHEKVKLQIVTVYLRRKRSEQPLRILKTFSDDQ